MNEIPWNELQQESKKFLTKNNKINYRIPEASREMFVEKIRVYIPWIESLSMALWCITERKTEMPSCEFCGNKALFVSSEKIFRTYCLDCKNKYIANKREKTMIEKYGVSNASGLDSRKEVMERVNSIRKEKFASGELQSWTKGKTKESDERIKKMAESMSQTKREKFESGELEVWNKGRTKENDERVAKYSDSMKRSWKGRKQTEAQKEVTKRFIESGANHIRTLDEFEKQRQTFLKKYGVPSYLSLVYKDGLEEIKKRYGGAYLGSEEWNSRKEAFFNKMKKTNLEKYGVECILSSKEIQEKIQKTKRLNHTFKDSKLERLSIKLLKDKLREVYVQYKDDRYPFMCDIYLPRFDMFIELNYRWTHGSEPFIDSFEQRKVLDSWKEKSETSPYYKNAIETWTVRDVTKNLFAEDNHLNYKSFYSFEEFKNFISTLEQESQVYQYFDLSYSDEPKEKSFRDLLSSYKSYNSKSKYNDLLLPFTWDIFYKKELELWKNEDIRRKLVQNRIMYLHKPESELTDLDLFRGFSRSLIHKGFSSFSPMIIKSFIRDYKISSIYDPCGGWGHRLLGAWNIEYWYNDFNSELVDRIRKIFCYYDDIEPSAKKYFSCNDAATFIPNRKFDAVFTCPPYYDVEDYNFEGDSSKLHPSYQDWLENWWGSLVKNSKQIAPIFAYVISSKFLEDMNILLERNGYYEVNRILVSQKRKNHMSVNAEEYLTIWRLKE